MRINTGCFLNGCKCFDPDDEDGVGVRADREWHGLTDEEIMKITGVTSSDSNWNVNIVHKWIRLIEAKLKEKNGK